MANFNMADPVSLQYQVRQNSEELQDFLKDLNKWERDVKEKDKSLTSSGASSVSSYPVRNKPQKKKSKPKPKANTTQLKPKLKGSDFQAWDKYDVDEALKEIEEEEEMQTQSMSDEDTDEDEGYAEQRRLQQALFEKEKGNDLFKDGKYEAAINRYTTAIGLDPYNAILPANRAMALIKVERYGAAIQDCDTALSLDKTYIKAYARRASAKQKLGRLQEALLDYKNIEKLQPGNKQAMEEIENINKMLVKKDKTGTDVNKQEDNKPPKKQMKRYVIEEIGTDSSDEDEAVSKKTENVSIKEDTNNKKSTRSTNETTENALRTENEIDLGNHFKKVLVNEQEKNSEQPVKTAAENTEYLKTNEGQDRISEQAVHSQSADQGCMHATAKCSARNIDLTPPTSSIQFQAKWKMLDKHPEELYKYMKCIPPDHLPKVVGECGESTLLMKMLVILRNFYVRDGLPIFNEIKCISEIKRFSMNMMFLTKDEKIVVKELFDYLLKIPNDKKTFTEDRLENLMEKYGLLR